MLDYIVDFYCHELMLAIEIDGDSHGFDVAFEKDKIRQQRLEEYEVMFIRFNDIDVKRNMPFVLDILLLRIEELKEF